MPKLSMLSLALCVGLAISAAIHAQAPAAPAPIPDAIPFDIPYGTPIGLDQAGKVAEAAMAEAKKRNWKDAIAITGPAGDLVYFVRMDGTQYASAKIAEPPASLRSATCLGLYAGVRPRVRASGAGTMPEATCA